MTLISVLKHASEIRLCVLECTVYIPTYVPKYPLRPIAPPITTHPQHAFSKWTCTLSTSNAGASLKFYCWMQGGPCVIVWCLMIWYKAPSLCSTPTPLKQPNACFDVEKSVREMSFLIRITFHQTPNASCFKEETCTPQPLRICHTILRYSYPKHVSQDLKVCVDFQKL